MVVYIRVLTSSRKVRELLCENGWDVEEFGERNPRRQPPPRCGPDRRPRPPLAPGHADLIWGPHRLQSPISPSVRFAEPRFTKLTPTPHDFFTATG